MATLMLILGVASATFILTMLLAAWLQAEAERKEESQWHNPVRIVMRSEVGTVLDLSCCHLAAFMDRYNLTSYRLVSGTSIGGVPAFIEVKKESSGVKAVPVWNRPVSFGASQN